MVMGVRMPAFAPPVLPRGARPNQEEGAAPSTRGTWPASSCEVAPAESEREHAQMHPQVSESVGLAEHVSPLEVPPRGGRVASSLRATCLLQLASEVSLQLGVHDSTSTCPAGRDFKAAHDSRMTENAD